MAALLLLGAGIPAFFLSNMPGKPSENAALLFSIVMWSTFRLIHTGLRGQRRLTLMCFYVFVYVFLGVQPLMSVWTGFFPYDLYNEPMPEPLVSATIGLVLAGIVAFELGYGASMRGPVGAPSRRHGTSPSQSKPIALSLLQLWVAVGVGMVTGSVLRYGPDLYLGVRGGGGISFGSAPTTAMSQAEWLFMVQGLRAFMAALLFVTLYLWLTRDSAGWPPHKIRRLSRTLKFLTLVNLLLSNPWNSARLWFGAVVVTLWFLWRPWHGSRSFLVWTMSACTGLLVLFAGIDPRRIIAQPMLRGEELTVASTVQGIKESIQNLQSDGNFDAFQMIALAKNYTDQTGYSFGRQMLLPVFFWVPRSLWPGKPVGTGDLVAESRGFIMTNVGSPLWAEGYMNLGILGIVLFLGTFGVIARMGDDFLTRTVAVEGAMLPTIASSFFAANTFILLRGDLTTGTMFVQMILGLTILMHWLIKRATPSRLPDQLRISSHA